MSEPYRPSNGSEGEAFFDALCSRCARDAAFRATNYEGDGALGCPILAATFALNLDHPDYPKEWIEDDAGARCTAFTTDPTMPTRCDKTVDMFAASPELTQQELS